MSFGKGGLFVRIQPQTERGQTREEKAILLAGLFLFFCLPILELSDCAEFGNLNRFIRQDDGRIIFHYNNVPLDRVALQDCIVHSSSEIRLLQGSVWGNNEILIDGKCGTIMSVTVD